MPQLDLESLFCVGGGESNSKVACETAALPGPDAVSGGQCDTADDHTGGRAASSWRIKRGDGISWGSCRSSVLTVAALERDGSTKGTSNPKTTVGKREGGASRPTRLPAVFVVGVLAGSGKVVLEQRCSPILGRRPATGARVFASEACTEAEPVSPKVSCFGAVRSERRAPAPVPPWEADKPLAEGCTTGCWASVTAAALHYLCCSSSNRCEGESESKEDTTPESPTVAVLSPPRPILGLGDVKRLASRRWPDGMPGDKRGQTEDES